MYDFGDDAGVVVDNATRFPGGGSSFGQEGACGLCDNIDPTTFNQVGKTGFGDLEQSPDYTKLYVTNLFDRKIYVIDVDNPTPGSATALPGIPWLDNSDCNNGTARPWALKWRRGKLFVGVVCDASTSSCDIGDACADLTANIYAFDGTTWTNELSFPLDYYRKAYSKGANYFVPWIDDWNKMKPFVENKTDANFAQPVIMDIEFDDDFSMIIGVGDRSGYQLGYQAPPPVGPISSTAERNMVYGDILRAAYDNNADAFVIENNGVVGDLTTTNPTGNSGPGGKSFYWGDYWTGVGAKKYQGGLGSLALLPGSGEVMFPVADAYDYYSNGVVWMSNTNGVDNKRLEVYQGSPNGNSANFAKSGGVGDMELMCAPPSVEIGNIVWWDEDADGLADPSEPGVPNVVVELWLDPNGSAQGNAQLDGSGVKVAQTTTDNYGRYVFSFDGNNNGLNAEDWSFTANDRILSNTMYQVRIPNWATDPGVVAFRDGIGYAMHLMSPTQNQGNDGNQRDSDGYDDSGNAAAAVRIAAPGDNDHSLDFAFSGVGGCTAPETIPTANTPCEGENLNLLATVSGGVPPYMYSWSGPSSFTASVENPVIASADSSLHAGTYYLTVTDNVGCADTVQLNVVVNKILLTGTTTDASCGNTDGAIDLTIQGGAPYIIDWDNDGVGDNDDTEDLTNLAAGTYMVSVTDADGCSATTNRNVNSTGSVSLAETHVHETCGNANGSINVTVTGDYTSILWSNGETTENITGLSAGTYSITVNNAANCPASLSIVIENTPAPTMIYAATDELCGAGNGTVNITVSGGTPPYVFDWDNDGTSDNDDVEDLTDLAAGTYTVIVIDANNCIVTDAVTVNSVAEPNLNITTVDESCSNANASINLTVTGGLPPFTYDWDYDGTGDNDDPEDISGIGAGNYSVTVTDSNSCTSTTMATIVDNVGPSLMVMPINSTNCTSTDGSIDLVVTGGTAPFSYDWSNDGMGDNDDTEDLNGLSSGAYTVMVTDANGCVSNVGASVVNAEDPVLNLIVTDPTTCSETGSIDLTVTGGTAPFTFDWDNDGVGDNDDTEDITGLVGGIYTVVVTGADGCSVQGSESIRIIREPALTVITTPPSCGAADGSLVLTYSDPDGTGPYTFDWDNDGTGDNDDAQNQSGLGAGNYTVSVTNGIGCVVIGTYSLSSATAPEITVFQTNPTCSGSNGLIDVEVVGGVPPYTYDWDDDGIGDNDDAEDLNTLPIGSYNLIVTDANGCQQSAAVVLVSSALPELNAVTQVDTCNSGSGEINLTINGIAPYSIDWDNDGTGDNDDSQDLSALSAGNYGVTVTDANGCSVNAMYIVAPTAVITPTATPLPCFDGGTPTDPLDDSFDVTLMATASNAGASNQFTVSDGTTTWGPFDYATGGTATGLPADGSTISLIFTDLDDNTCLATTDVSSISCSNSISCTTTITPNGNSICEGSDLILTVTANNAITSWSWAGPNGFTSTEQNPTIIAADSLATGVYTVTVVDSDGCTITDTIDVEVQAVPLIEELCDGESILLEAEAGHTSYQWYKDGVAIAIVDGGDQQTYIITEPGEYNFTVDGAILDGTCLNQMCCPVVVVAGVCPDPCTPKICVPISITKVE